MDYVDRLKSCERGHTTGDGSGQMHGYRAMCRQVPRLVVQTILREVDPEGSQLR